MALSKETPKLHSIQVSIDPDSGEVVGCNLSYGYRVIDSESGETLNAARTLDLWEDIRKEAVAQTFKDAEAGKAEPLVSDAAALMRERLSTDSAFVAATTLAVEASKIVKES